MITRPDDARMRNYGYDYMMRSSDAWKARRIRVEDMFNAVCYAYGYSSELEVTRVFNSVPATADFHEQMKAMKAGATRWPRFVLDVGGGRGELLAVFKSEGVTCHSVDPSPGSRQAVPETMRLWLGADVSSGFYNVGILDYLVENGYGGWDTVVFCESMEHIPERELMLALPLIVWGLRATGGRLIVTNWFALHPIKPDPSGWDHVTRIDDSLYDRLITYAARVIQRRASHLVLQF